MNIIADKTAPHRINLLSGKSILLVDDQDEIRELISTILEEYNVNIIQAEDGEQALLKFKQHREELDLVIMDINMPKMDGVTAYQHICDIKEHFPILYLSGQLSNESVLTLKDDANVNFMMKPFQLDDFIDQIKKILK